jgi:hypothetical protein
MLASAVPTTPRPANIARCDIGECERDSSSGIITFSSAVNSGSR